MTRHHIEQGSPEWHQLRVGKITSTRLKKLMSSSNLDLIDELIAEMELGYSDDDDYVSPEMQWGLDNEAPAIEMYEQITGNKTERIGMLQSDEFPILTVSPDRLVGEYGAVEVKCLKTKNHIKAIRMGGVPNDYKYQVMQYFLVHTDLKWLDFVSFDPRLTSKPIYIYRVEREAISQELSDTTEAVKKFLTKLEKYKEQIFRL